MALFGKLRNSFATLFRVNDEEIRYPGSNWSVYWREKVIKTATIAGFYMGLILYFPTFIWDILNKYYGIAIFNSCVFSLFIVFVFTRAISARTKSIMFSLAIYLIGVVITVQLGSIGGGIVWLCVFPIAASLLISLKAAWNATLVNFLTLLVIGIGIPLGWYHGSEMQGYDIRTWIVISINVMGLSGVYSVTIGVLLRALDKSIIEQHKTQAKLNEEMEMMQLLKNKAEHSDRLKSSFLANVSHELRTPMNAIIGFSDLLLKKSMPREKELAYIRIINERCNLLLHLFNDIIDISRIEANLLEIHKESGAIAPMLQELYELYDLIRIQQGKEAISLICIGMENEVMVADLDQFRVKQVISNLLSNALKHTVRGKIEFGVELLNGKDELRFFVRDTGKGISAEKHAIIFERYMQAESNAVQMQHGFGLGLAICRSLVELMGGRIWVESEPGKGSEFIFTLPRYQGQPQFNFRGQQELN